MGTLEIVVLIAGGIIFILSFILPRKAEGLTKESKEYAKKEVKALVEKQMDSVRSHVDEVVDETVEYAVEKTERSLERLTNEKIMAVNEYSDTVLQEIHKNHEEIMFLYDMLNSKHINLKNTVSEINKTVKEAEETKKEAEAVMNIFQRLQTEEEMEEESAFEVLQNKDDDLVSVTEEQISNKNEKILELHKQGKSIVLIAKELGVGVGEVQLVVDLHKNK